MQGEFIYRFPDFERAYNTAMELEKFPTDVVTGLNYFQREGERLYILAVFVEGREEDLRKIEGILKNLGTYYPKRIGELLTERWDLQFLGTAAPMLRALKGIN